MYYKYLFFAFLFFCSVKSSEKRLPVWGNYCGKGHTNQRGIEPIDQMDRYCQYHDICVTVLGFLDCWCNEQLYYLVSNIKPQNLEESDIKDSILTFIFDAVIGCENYWGFDKIFVVTGVEKWMESRGYNYLAYYPSSSIQSYKINNLVPGDTDFILRLNKGQYYEFTNDVYQDPVNRISKWLQYKVKDLDVSEYDFEINPGEYYVVYNPSNFTSVYQVQNRTECISKPVSHGRVMGHETFILFLGGFACLIIVGLAFLSLGLAYRLYKNKRDQTASIKLSDIESI